MKNFKVIPLATEVAQKIRTSTEDDYGHELKHTTPTGRALCRLCLGDGGPDQKHILFSFMPFDENKNPYSEVGPVYVHDKCEQYEDSNVFPPDLKKRKYLQVRGYDVGQRLIAADLSEGKDVEGTVDKLFEDLEVEYLHIRDGLTGCYFMKIERS